ncbi:transglutaminase family protein [Halalkalibaculum sp. DA384]|uniref:transglutaminase-like domain-containing protein n=1 Tax=Halalkalibaculum sp. DA384 TaxID=3373606 RepID=UPI003754DE3D
MPLLAQQHTTEHPNSQRSTPRLAGGTGSVRPANSPTLERLPYPGLNGVLERMREMVEKYKGHPKIRDWAVKITAGTPRDIRTGLPDRRNFHNIADAVYQWMKKNVAYVRDPHDIEWLQSPIRTLEKREGLKYGYGDCDDQSIAAATLLSSIGIPTRFKVVKADPGKPNAYSHVYLEYKADGQWKPFDPTLHTQAGDGLKDHQIFASRTIPLGDPLHDSLHGCRCSGDGLSGIPGITYWKLTGVVLLAGALALSWWRCRNRSM